MSNELHDYFNGNKTESSEKIFNLYSKTYQVNREIIKQFEDPKYLLDYFNEECLRELKSLHIQADYSRSYTSIEDDFSYFVNAVIAQYLKLGLVQIKGLDNIGIKYGLSKTKFKCILY
jgi:leucyl-tRNA synthetase